MTIISKYMSLKSASSLEGDGISETVTKVVFDDAFMVAELYCLCKYGQKYQAVNPKIFYLSSHQEKLDSLVEKYGLNPELDVPLAIQLIHGQMKSPAEIMESEGDVECWDTTHLDKNRVLLEFYFPYRWWMKFHKNIPDGEKQLDEVLERTKEAFTRVGIQGRFKWNLFTSARKWYA